MNIINLLCLRYESLNVKQTAPNGMGWPGLAPASLRNRCIQLKHSKHRDKLVYLYVSKDGEIEIMRLGSDQWKPIGEISEPDILERLDKEVGYDDCSNISRTIGYS